MEVGQHVLALNVFGNETELAISYLITLKVSLVHLKHTSFEAITGQLWGEKEVR